MKRISVVLLCVSCVVLTMSSCGSLKSMKKNAGKVQYEIVPEVLEVHGGIVKTDITINYPTKYFKKKVTLTATPEIQYAGQADALKKFGVQGEKVRGNYESIAYKVGGQYKYNDMFLYKDAMINSELVADIVGTKGLKSRRVSNVKLADGVIATSRLIALTPRAIMAKDNYVQITEDAIEGQIMYVINQSNVRKSELNSETMNQLRSDMVAVRDNDRVEIKNAQVLAYASPDGELGFNTKLANKRTDTGKEVFIKDLKEANIYDGSDNGFLELLTTPEDWDGFKTMMEQSNIKDKELIIRVLNMYSDPVVREREIKNIASVYGEIKDQILPQLRRARLRLNLNIIGFSDAELKDLGVSNPSVLTEEEILHSAALYEGDSSRQISILEVANKNYSNSWRVKNNLGVAYLEAGRINNAEELITAAARIDNNAIVANNMAAVNILKGENNKAVTNLAAATNAGPEVNYNLGLLYTIMGEYSDALAKFGNEVDINVAFAQLLSKKEGAALSILNQLNGEDALVAYLKAIVGARQGNESLLYDNLTKAVKDGKLAANAKKDLEFAKYMNTDRFKSIVR